MVKQQTYGTWKSPISPRSLASSMRLNDVQWDSDSETLVWSERRGDGTVLVMQRGTDAMRDLLDASYTVGGRVGYGGGEFTVHDGIVYFVGRGHLHMLPLSGGTPRPITPRFGGAAAPTVSPDGKWVAFVHNEKNTDVLAIADTQGESWPQKIAKGDDFYMQPAWHPDGTHLAYIAWNHPQMPWNGTQLRIITLEQAGDNPPRKLAEQVIVGDDETAIFQPSFSPDGKTLAYISDATGYGHLYLYDLESGAHKQITYGDVEHVIPAWVQGMRTYGWTGDGAAIYYMRHENARCTLWLYDVEHETSLPVKELNDYAYLDHIAVAPHGEKVAMIASSSVIPPRIVAYDSKTGVRVVRRATTEMIPDAYLSEAQAIEWVGHDNEAVHGLYFPPQNPKFEGINTPPLMVLIHGGPTSQRMMKFDDEVQFFTTRGFAVLQVNHRGSTGYGKAYMNKHAGNWGVYDVKDSVSGAMHLIKLGLAAEDKIVIMGGSAGGYTVLQALVDHPGFFKAGVCSYGIANQFMLVMDTHKFEARYSEWLLGALPDAADTYRDRSPLFHARNIRDALIVFQGEDDNIVPKNQSDMIVEAIKRNKVPHEYIVYEGEGHGFRQPANVADFYEKTLRFLYQHVIYA